VVLWKDDYDQKFCCTKHQDLRDAMMDVWNALDHFNVMAWMEGGAAIRIARHGGRIVPL